LTSPSSYDSSDVVCAREGYTLLKKLRSGGDFTPRARVEPWAHGVDTLRAFVAFANAGEGAAAAASACSQPGDGEGVWPEVHALLAAGLHDLADTCFTKTIAIGGGSVKVVDAAVKCRV
jgi:hypothetical protein